jgi:hypothetical protein
MERQVCLTQECRAAFEASPAQLDDVRHCNRTGPDGGHAHRWDGARWQLQTGVMEHDRP